MMYRVFLFIFSSGFIAHSALSQHVDVVLNDPNTTTAIRGEYGGTGVGVLAEVGVLGRSIGLGDGWNYGVLGECFGVGGPQFGVYGSSSGFGVYGTASGNGPHIGMFAQIFGTSMSLRRVAVQGSIESGTTVGAGGVMQAGYFLGNVEVTGVLTQGSDRKLKRNIVDAPTSLMDINRLSVRQYEYQNDKYNGSFPSGVQYGFVAQELRKVYPHLTSTTAFGPKLGEDPEEYNRNFESKKYLAVNYIGLIPILTKGIQELHEIIEGQEKDLGLYRSLLEEMRDEINQLKALILLGDGEK